MDLLGEILKCFKIKPANVSERGKIVEISINCTKNNVENIQVLTEELRKFPNRDQITIKLSSGTDRCLLSNKDNKDNYLNRLEYFLKDIDYDDEIIVKIEINKNIENNTISIYNFKSFSEELVNKDILEIIGSFNNYLNGLEYLVFELFDSNYFFQTNTMIFKSPGDTIKSSDFYRKEKMETCHQISYFYNISEYELIPDDFHFISTCAQNPFEEIFGIIKTILSLSYISNTASIKDGCLKLQISGHRNINFCYLLTDGKIKPNEELYKIYNWIYTDGNPVDKAIIARNIISLHCKYSDLIDTDSKTSASIHSNYAFYQKDNVAQYLELKKNLGEYIMNLASQSSDIVFGLIEQMRNNIIAFLTFLITVFITNTVQNSSLKNIFTMDVTILTYLILLGSLVYLGISLMGVNIKLNGLKQGYIGLKNNYSELLDEKDIKEIFKDDVVLKESIKKLEKSKKLIILSWIAVIIIMLIAVELLSESPVFIPVLSKLVFFVEKVVQTMKIN